MREGIYRGLLTFFDEIGIPAVEVMAGPEFYAFLDAFSQARARGEYSGDDEEYFGADVIGVYQILYSGDDIPEMFRTLVIPMLDEDTARLHTRLSALYHSQRERERMSAEAERVSAEAERVSAEADASAETARAIREMLGVPPP